MVTMRRDEFEGIVADALDEVPPRFMAALDNVVFLVEDDPPPELEGCLGVYDGVPATVMALGEIPQGRSSNFPTLGGCHCSGRRVPVAA